ncbi:MAG: hypothetical protein KGK08_12045 [Acidobacteriota bacterium]|nr:hypothetical protein [Acidobacteriota bacterium]
MSNSARMPSTLSQPSSTDRRGRNATPAAWRVPQALLQGWHLLSLDAPSVAVCWTWFVASACQIPLSRAMTLALFLAVWLLYAADRLLDARQLFVDPLHTAQLEARHLFPHRHYKAFLTATALVTLALATLVHALPSPILLRYLVLAVLLGGYLTIIHSVAAPQRLPKEFAVGLVFAAFVFLPAGTMAPQLQSQLVGPAAAFAALCTFNCLFIYAWEHFGDSPQYPEANPLTRAVLPYLPIAAVAFLLLMLAGATRHRTPASPLYLAIALSTLLLGVLHGLRHRLQPITLRAAADAVLLTPLLWLLPRV